MTINRGIYKATLESGRWVIRHGSKVRVSFTTRAQAEEYLDWVIAPPD